MLHYSRLDGDHEVLRCWMANIRDITTWYEWFAFEVLLALVRALARC